MHDYTPETGDAADKVLKVAIKRRQMCLDAEGDTRNASLDDLKFASGDQWPDQYPVRPGYHSIVPASPSTKRASFSGR